jgi:hypothetical protein
MVFQPENKTGQGRSIPTTFARRVARTGAAGDTPTSDAHTNHASGHRPKWAGHPRLPLVVWRVSGVRIATLQDEGMI